jgi:cyclopropane fatty-acyl-phospholipid synthase-like methyltransferase
LKDIDHVWARLIDMFSSALFSEMIEHVGHEYMDEFFSCCEQHLKEHGLFVLQVHAFPAPYRLHIH